MSSFCQCNSGGEMMRGFEKLPVKEAVFTLGDCEGAGKGILAKAGGLYQ